MAKRKNGFDITALEKYAEQLQEAGGDAALHRAVQSGMIAGKSGINSLINAAMQAGNLPAGGIYSTGETLRSLDKNMTVEWSGNLAELPLGFDLSNGGMVSIFLMHGTPKMRPAAGLYDALYGNAGRAKARKEQKKAMQKVLERLGG